MGDKTAVIEGRVDIRHLATCASFMEERGQVPKSKSDLLYAICEMLASAIESAEGRVYKSHEEAYSYLAGIVLGPMTKKRGERRVGQEALSRAISEERGGETEYDDEDAMKREMERILAKLKGTPK